MKFKRANLYQAAFFFLFERNKYVELGINHNIAINLEASDIFLLYQKGLYPKEGWEVESRFDVSDGAKELTESIWTAFWTIIICAVIAFHIGFLSKKIHPLFEIDWNLTIIAMGTFLTSWATLMALSGGYKTWGGKTLHELLHPLFFKIIFIPGVLLIFIGLII